METREERIEFYIDGDEIFCEYNCTDILKFRTLVFSIFSGSLSIGSLQFIIEDMIENNKLELAEQINVIKSVIEIKNNNKEQSEEDLPIVSPINYR